MGQPLVLTLPFAALLVAASAVDLARRVVPNRLVAGGAVAGLAGIVATAPATLPVRLTVASAVGGAFLALALAAPGSMGMGDVKLVTVMGLVLGPAVLAAIAVAALAGTLAGLAVVARDGLRAGRAATLPFAPFLALGGAAALLGGGVGR